MTLVILLNSALSSCPKQPAVSLVWENNLSAAMLLLFLTLRTCPEVLASLSPETLTPTCCSFWANSSQIWRNLLYFTLESFVILGGLCFVLFVTIFHLCSPSKGQYGGFQHNFCLKEPFWSFNLIRIMPAASSSPVWLSVPAAASCWHCTIQSH